MNSKNNTTSLVITALFTAILCVSAYISIPLPTGHITLLNFIVLLIAFLFPLKQSISILLIWMLLGCAGVPVFVGGIGGISYIVSSLGGYNIGFILIAILIPLLRGKTYRRAYYTFLAVVANLLVDAIGAAWMMAFTGISAGQAAATGFLPFIPLDLVKAVIAAQILPQFRKITVLTIHNVSPIPPQDVKNIHH